MNTAYSLLKVLTTCIQYIVLYTTYIVHDIALQTYKMVLQKTTTLGLKEKEQQVSGVKHAESADST